MRDDSFSGLKCAEFYHLFIVITEVINYKMALFPSLHW